VLVAKRRRCAKYDANRDRFDGRLRRARVLRSVWALAGQPDVMRHVVMAALLITLVVLVSKMPDSNPLKRLLTALSYRLGATLAGCPNVI
jgi:hypothetical protein